MHKMSTGFILTEGAYNGHEADGRDQGRGEPRRADRISGSDVRLGRPPERGGMERQDPLPPQPGAHEGADREDDQCQLPAQEPDAVSARPQRVDHTGQEVVTEHFVTTPIWINLVRSDSPHRDRPITTTNQRSPTW